MWPKSSDAALTADRTYLRDYAGWVSSIHGVEARALVAAIRQSDDRNLRKALSTRLMQSRVSALLSIGFLYVAVRERFGSSLLRARLRADAASARLALRQASLASGAGFWRFLRLPEPTELRKAEVDPAAVNEYVDSGEQRLANLARISQIARQDMLLSTLDAGRHNRIIVASPRSVGLIKTGQESELHGLSNTAFCLVDLSGGELQDEGDLVAVASPTTPAVIEEIAEEIAFIDAEAAATAALVSLVADAGLLESGDEGPSLDDFL